MLNSETKRHIDAARDVLVGVAPNPTTQIDQITYALIYKFMDDMDQAAIKAGGEPSFFTGELEPYAWSKLVDSRMGNQEKMNLYGEALTKFSEAKQLPELFRTIFRAAFLPYRSPETLGLFLKEISYFDYTHPEELGNAYEYLLSIMSSQGDAGQFRTPRHIIDFIVDVINPTKDDKVLDPACGTAGFLVSTYNHILEQHDGKSDPKKSEQPLTPDERKKLMQNLQGYDIDPTMVRIAQVNMYLHQFKNPQIFQYDSLTSEERWADKFDVILANPPFMSPKGGIKPHNKFGIASNRSEVLFVDYIINHLRPKGRAGIIVPEGIIFQSGVAYKALRKNLVENGLYAVVSLPGGVFQPYSGVKTSILLFNNELAKQKTEIVFIKISADGFDLGATKRAVSENDLPVALEVLESWVKGKTIEAPIASFISKEEIATKGDYNLSGDRYKVGVDYSNSTWPMAKISELTILFDDGNWIESKDQSPDGLRLIQTGNVGLGEYLDKTKNSKFISEETFTRLKCTEIFEGDVLVSRLPEPVGRMCVIPALSKRAITAVDCTIVRLDHTKCLPKFLVYISNSPYYFEQVEAFHTGASRVRISRSNLANIEIPLPPLDVQAQIVAELDGYAAIISGAKQIVENWKPRIEVDPEWEVVGLGETCLFINGDRSSNYPTNRTQDSSGIPFINAGNLSEGKISLVGADFITDSQFSKISSGKIEIGDVLFCLRGSLGKMALNTELTQGAIASSLIILRANPKTIDPLYLYTVLASDIGQNQIAGQQTGAAQPNLAAGNLKSFKIPLPPLNIQKEIVEKIRAEEAHIESAKGLIDLYQDRMKSRIAKLWSE